MRKHHELKVWPGFYDQLERGTKTFELRKNDRDFQPHDTLTLKEWDPERETYSGREMSGLHITSVLEKFAGIQEGYCIFTFRRDQ